MNSPINADGTEIEDARRAHHHIQSDKDVTVDLAEAPLSHHLEENKQQQSEDSSERQQTEQSRPAPPSPTPRVKPTYPDSDVWSFYKISTPTSLRLLLVHEGEEVKRC